VVADFLFGSTAFLVGCCDKFPPNNNNNTSLAAEFLLKYLFGLSLRVY
jgi:hypothetical protein